MSDSSTNRSDLLTCVALTAVWLSIVAFIGVHGEFPLNDDWAYSIPTRHLLQTGKFERLPWTWTPIITHVALGVLFAKVLGFSLTSMRWVGVVSGWVGVIGTYALFRRIGIARKLALVGTAVAVFNPLYVNLAFTFMLDVPLTALLTWSLAMAVTAAQLSGAGSSVERASARRARLAWLGAFGLALAATASRQTAVAMVVSMAAALGLTQIRRLWHLAAGLGLAVALLSVDQLIDAHFFGSGDRGGMAGIAFILEYIRENHMVQIIAYTASSMLCCVGMLLLPVFVLLVRWDDALCRRLLTLSALLGSATFAVLRKIGWDTLPAEQNIIGEDHIGPITFDPWHTASPVLQAMWGVITLAGLWCVYYAVLSLLTGAFRARSEVRRSVIWIALLAFPPLYLAPQLLHIPFFDRYVLPVLPVMAAALLALPGQPSTANPKRLWLAASLLGVELLLGVLGTRDYLEHNRAVWALVAEPLRRGVPPEDIDGGFEYRGYYHFEGPSERMKIVIRDDHRNTERYIVSPAAKADGYRVVAQRSYFRWLPPSPHTLSLLERVQ